MQRKIWSHSLLILFWPVTALVLYLDSSGISQLFPHSQLLSDLITLAYLAALIGCMKQRRRLLAIIFVPLSAIGEAGFTMGLALYGYRLGYIPLYVPLGHSVLLTVGLGYSELVFARLYRPTLLKCLVLFHGLLIAGTFLLFGDSLSLIWGCVFAAMFPWLRKRVAYLMVGVLVLYIELLGTAWGCWSWRPEPFGALRTFNPPSGAFACYVIAEIIAVWCAAQLASWWSHRGIGVSMDVRPAEI